MITICTTPFTCCLRRASRSTHRAAWHAPPAYSIDRKDTAIYYRFMGGACASGSGQQNADDLLPLALSRPQEALTEAHAVLAEQPGPYPASVAHQAAGIVLRDTGDVSAGVRELRAALRLARRTGSTEREADVLATLGLTLTYARRTAAGLAAFDRALDLSSGAAAGRVRYRRAVALWRLGRYAAALEDLRRAADVLQGANDPVWMSRTLNGRGLVYLALGLPGRADADFAAAGGLTLKPARSSNQSIPSRTARLALSPEEISPRHSPLLMKLLRATGR